MADSVTLSLKQYNDLKEDIKNLEADIKEKAEIICELTGSVLEKDIEISRLKHRNLWQRILNK